jgi:hypothetical protein
LWGTIEDETERLASAAPDQTENERMESLGALAGGIARLHNMLAVNSVQTSILHWESRLLPTAVAERLESALPACEREADSTDADLQPTNRYGAWRIDLTALAVESILLRSTMSTRVHLEVALPQEAVVVSGNATGTARCSSIFV